MLRSPEPAVGRIILHVGMVCPTDGRHDMRMTDPCLIHMARGRGARQCDGDGTEVSDVGRGLRVGQSTLERGA
jgi:hypothetical protein